MSRETDTEPGGVDVADSLEGRAVAQWAFGYFLQRRVPGGLAGGLAEILALSVISQFAQEGKRGTPATPTSILAAVERAVETFLTKTGAPDTSQTDALTDVVCAALNSAANAQPKDDKPVTTH